MSAATAAARASTLNALDLLEGFETCYLPVGKMGTHPLNALDLLEGFETSTNLTAAKVTIAPECLRPVRRF